MTLPAIIVLAEGTTPTNYPPTGQWYFYFKSDGAYIMDDTGTETNLGSGGSFSSFDLAADSGTPETVDDSETVTIAGGTGIDTSVAATNTVTVAIDSTVATLTGSQTLTNKTLTTPTIGDLTNATHDHSDAANGGAIDASVVTYTPSVATDWDGDADPGDLDDALNQLAERVDDLEGAGGGGVITPEDGAYTSGSSYQTTSTTLVDVDATNVEITLTPTGSGYVRVTFRFTCHLVGGTGGNTMRLAISDGSTTSDELIISVTRGEQYVSVSAIFAVTAVSTTFTLQYRRTTTNGTATIFNVADSINWDIVNA